MNKYTHMYICIINDFMFIFGLFTLVNSDEKIVVCMTGNKRKEGRKCLI